MAITFTATEPIEILSVPMPRGTTFDVTSDGQRFLFATFPSSAGADPEEPADRIRVVLNWFDALKRLVPVGR